jgi:hypothetical protein
MPRTPERTANGLVVVVRYTSVNGASRASGDKLVIVLKCSYRDRGDQRFALLETTVVCVFTSDATFEKRTKCKTVRTTPAIHGDANPHKHVGIQGVYSTANPTRRAAMAVTTTETEGVDDF